MHQVPGLQGTPCVPPGAVHLVLRLCRLLDVGQGPQAGLVVCLFAISVSLGDGIAGLGQMPPVSALEGS